MYNQYLDRSEWVQLDPEPQEKPSGRRAPTGRSQPETPPSRSAGSIQSELTGGIVKAISSILKHFSLEHFDTGDILLVLIILFLFLEGDNLELVITLGLMLLLGLGDDKDHPSE